MPTADNEKSNIFFVVGIPRSGTTLLEQMLNGHSKVVVAPEISSGKILWRMNAGRSIKNKWAHLLIINYLYRQSLLFKDSIGEILFNHARLQHHFPIKTSNWFEPIIKKYKSQKNAIWYGEKTPDNIFYISTLEKIMASI